MSHAEEYSLRDGLSESSEDSSKEASGETRIYMILVKEYKQLSTHLGRLLLFVRNRYHHYGFSTFLSMGTCENSCSYSFLLKISNHLQANSASFPGA